MDLFERFIEKALHADGNFVLQRKDGCATLFVPVKFKASTFIYEILSRKEAFCIDTKNMEGFRLAAVRYGDQLAIRDILFSREKNTGCSIADVSIVTWPELHKQIMDKAWNEVFEPLLRGLELDPDVSAEEVEKKSREDARWFFLSNKTFDFWEPYPEMIMGDDEVLLYLSDALDMKAHCKKVLDENKTELSNLKAHRKRYEELISGDSSEVVQDWELRLANALHAINGKNVLVTFAVSDKEADGKMPIEDLLYCLSGNNTIDPCNFLPGKENDIYTALNLNLWKDKLLCENIKKLTFRGKEIFSR